MKGQTPKRPPRKDFMSLMEHTHSFAHMHIRDQFKSMSIELWPMHLRAPTGTTLNFVNGPIPYLLEQGDETPIINVHKATGWRMAAANAVAANFQTLGLEGKEHNFALLLDEYRLFQAIAQLVQSTELYEHSSQVMAFQADDVVAENISGITFLRFKFHKAASFAVFFDERVLGRLRAALKEN